MPLTLDRGQKILFIGDSITDCSRREDPERLGNGYVRLIRDYLYAKNPSAAPLVINMGISGNKVTDLQTRWKEDVLEHEPDVVSIKIGINDVWHGLGGNTNGVPINHFVDVYHVILRQLNAVVPKAKLVLCQPSVIWPPAPAEGNAALQPYVRAVGELRREFNAAAVVAVHAAFVNAQKARPDIVWAPDGVHPGSAGHMLIARTWLVETGLL